VRYFIQFVFVFIGAVYAFFPTLANANSLVFLRPAQRLSGDTRIVLGNLGLGQCFTLSIWVKPAEGKNQDWAAIIDYRHKATKSFAFHQKGSEMHHFAFGVHAKNGVYGVYAKLKPLQWQHVLLVKATDFMAIFIDGELMDKTVLSPTFHIDYTGDEILTVGGWGYGNREWLGAVSCIAIFDVPITEEEINVLSKQVECKNEQS